MMKALKSRTSAKPLAHRVFAAIASVALAISCLAVGGIAFAAGGDGTVIKIISTNDIHTAIETTDDPSTLGYDGIAGYRQELEQTYDNVLLVDAGDYLEGGLVGAFSKGINPANLINAAEYDVLGVGNHEFGYGAEQLLKVARGEAVLDGNPDVKAESPLPITCCNLFNTETGDLVFSQYIVKEVSTSAGAKKVAFIGVATPSSMSTTNPANFKNADGKTIYDFCGDATGEKLYACVQGAIDAARTVGGADYVILLAHLGLEGSAAIWRSDTLVSNISGADFVIDAHTHKKYVTTAADKGGKEITIIQAGTEGEAIGTTTIDVTKTGPEAFSTVLTDAADITAAPDAALAAAIGKINDGIKEIRATVVGHSGFDLVANDLGTGELEGKRLARTTETNLGDLAADSILAFSGADIAIVNGGALRSNIAKGDITLDKILTAFPFLNYVSVVQTTGQDILDALEMGVRNYPEENGGFLHVAGMTYRFDKSIPSSVVLDGSGNFAGVSGARRVYEAKINGADIDPDASYKLAGVQFLVVDGGDGYAMFCNSPVVADEIALDYVLLSDYVSETLGGEIPERYSNPLGEGRINGKASEEDPNPGEGDSPGLPSTEDATPWQPLALMGGLAAVAGSVAFVRMRRNAA